MSTTDPASSSEAVVHIAEVLGEHRLEKSARLTPTERTEWWTCLGCDWASEEFDLDDSEVAREIERVKRRHLGEAVAAALGGITRELHTYRRQSV